MATLQPTLTKYYLFHVTVTVRLDVQHGGCVAERDYNIVARDIPDAIRQTEHVPGVCDSDIKSITKGIEVYV